MAKSKEFNRGGETDPKKVVTRTGPLGLVPSTCTIKGEIPDLISNAGTIRIRL